MWLPQSYINTKYFLYTLALLNHNIYGCHVRYFKDELASPLLLHKYSSRDCNLIKPLKRNSRKIIFILHVSCKFSLNEDIKTIRINHAK